MIDDLIKMNDGLVHLIYWNRSKVIVWNSLFNRFLLVFSLELLIFIQMFFTLNVKVTVIINYESMNPNPNPRVW